jgi:ABC-type Co2+ transport system permease subunit
MLFAVHISDGVLTLPWLGAGFAIAAALLAMAAWRLHENDIPRVALLTAAFFVSSLIHIRVGPTSIHLLLSGLIGVLLGPRAALAIFVGLLLQVILIQHGGYFTLGVNTCVMAIPAFACWGAFRLLHRLPWATEPAGRAMFVGIGAILWFLSGLYSVTLIANTSLAAMDMAAFEAANAQLVNPWILGAALLFAIIMVAIERRLENTPEFPLGFLIGEVSVLMTAALNCVVLILGGEEHWPMPPLLLVVAHLPFAVIEGVILGFVIGFLAKVKPEMLGITREWYLNVQDATAIHPAPSNDGIMVKDASITNRPPSDR